MEQGSSEMSKRRASREHVRVTRGKQGGSCKDWPPAHRQESARSQSPPTSAGKDRMSGDLDNCEYDDATEGLITRHGMGRTQRLVLVAAAPNFSINIYL